MKVLQVIVEVLVALLAVIGVYSLWRLFSDRLFGTDRLILTIEILTEEDASQAEFLVRDAMTHVLWMRSGRIFLLTTAELAEHEGILSAMRTYGVSCRILADPS